MCSPQVIGMPRGQTTAVPAASAVPHTTISLTEEHTDELDQLPDGMGYESLDENDAPMYNDRSLGEEELIGFDEFARKHAPPTGGAPFDYSDAAALHRTALAPLPAAQPQMQQLAVVVPAGVVQGQTLTKKLTDAQRRKAESDSNGTQWDSNNGQSLSFGRPDFRAYKEGDEPAVGFVLDVSCEKGGPRPGHKHLSLDEMTMGFKGRCAMVTRIKCTPEGDGFQCDCICADGYC